MTDRHPLFFTLDDGVYLALRCETKLCEMNITHWARTYHATETEVREAIDNARARLLKEGTKLAPNSPMEVEGK